MSRTRVATLAFSLLTVLTAGLGGALAVVGGTSAQQGYVVAGAALASVPVGSALLVSRAAPTNVLAALLAAAGLSVAFTVTLDVYLDAAAAGRLRVLDGLVMVGRGTWMLLFIPLAVLILLFPTGRLPGPRWRVVPVGLAVAFVVFEAGQVMWAGAYDAPWQELGHPRSPVLTALSFVMLPLFLGLLLAATASVFVRYRSAGAVERHQIRWLQLAGTSVPLTLLLCWLSYLLLDGPDLVVVGLVVMYVSLPVATAIAITRHDRFDVDRAVAATTGYGVIAAALLAVFTAVSSLAGLLVGRDSTAAGVVVTAALAVALGSTRGRLTRRIAALLQPGQARVLRAVADLRERVQDGSAVPEQLEGVLRRALCDSGLRVGYIEPDRTAYVDRDGAAVPETPYAARVLLADHPVGILVPGQRTPSWILRPLTQAVALLMETARLRLELGHALREVEASRGRLLRAGYQERRRLEQDLHDGAQQRLVSLGMSLRLAQRHLHDPDVDLDEIFDDAVAEIGTVVTELRHIAHGLRPSCMDDGLQAALANLTSSTPLPVGIDLDADDLPDHVSTTAYYVAAEAVANVVKHADAESITMSVRRQDGAVTVRVRDDGRGGAAVRPGSGLAGLRDRVAAIGGTLGVVSEAGAGTVIEAVLPCGS